jgi:hypothetical protein
MPKSRGQNRPPRIPQPPKLPPLPPAKPQLILGYDPTGPTKQRDIVSVKNGWSEYTLDDGAVIRTKGVLVEAKEMVDQFNSTGDPIYVLQLSVIHELVVPEELKKPKPEAAKSEAQQKTEEKK